MQQLEILAWMEAKTWIKRQDLKPLYYSWCLLWNDFKDVTEKNEFDKSVWCVFMVGGYGRTYYSVNCHIYNESCWDFMTQFDCRFTYKKVPCYYYVCLFFDIFGPYLFGHWVFWKYFGVQYIMYRSTMVLLYDTSTASWHCQRTFFVRVIYVFEAAAELWHV